MGFFSTIAISYKNIAIANRSCMNQSINQKRIKVTKVTNVTARPVLVNEGPLK